MTKKKKNFTLKEHLPLIEMQFGLLIMKTLSVTRYTLLVDDKEESQRGEVDLACMETEVKLIPFSFLI